MTIPKLFYSKFLFTLLLITSSNSLNAQTLDETISYLKTYYKNISDCSGKEISIIYLGSSVSKRTPTIHIKECISFFTESGECTDFSYRGIHMETVTGISYFYQKFHQTSDKTYKLEGWRVVINYVDDYYAPSPEKKELMLCIEKNIEESYIKRLKNALTNLASLAGAKMVDEKMFD